MSVVWRCTVKMTIRFISTHSVYCLFLHFSGLLFPLPQNELLEMFYCVFHLRVPTWTDNYSKALTSIGGLQCSVLVVYVHRYIHIEDDQLGLNGVHYREVTLYCLCRSYWAHSWTQWGPTDLTHHISTFPVQFVHQSLHAVHPTPSPPTHVHV